MRYRIVFWHGQDDRLLADLKAADSELIEECGKYYFAGSLDEFAHLWDRPFIVRPDHCICISQYNNFGQR
jgi:hypothetical protein